MTRHDDMTAVALVASTGTAYGTAEVHSNPGTVAIWIGDEGEFVGFGADLSPACARDLAAALYAHADAAETMPATTPAHITSPKD